MADNDLVITPARLLRAIAEQETLEATCAALPGMTRERAQKLLQGMALAMERASAAPAPAPAAAKSSPAIAPSQPGAVKSVGTATKSVATAINSNKLIVYSDGASRGNPGPAGAGAVLADASGAIVQRLGKFLGTQTNNYAEYHGLLLGLRAALAAGAREVDVRADSELMIKQLKGEYRVKNANIAPLHAEATKLLHQFAKYSLRHVYREQNSAADEMSNRAIDEKM